MFLYGLAGSSPFDLCVLIGCWLVRAQARSHSSMHVHMLRRGGGVNLFEDGAQTQLKKDPSKKKDPSQNTIFEEHLFCLRWILLCCDGSSFFAMGCSLCDGSSFIYVCFFPVFSFQFSFFNFWGSIATEHSGDPSDGSFCTTGRRRADNNE